VAGVHWISLTETSEAAAIRMIQNLLAEARDLPQETLPETQRQGQRNRCTCSLLAGAP
jgi:hypothetical protein